MHHRLYTLLEETQVLGVRLEVALRCDSQGHRSSPGEGQGRERQRDRRFDGRGRDPLQRRRGSLARDVPDRAVQPGIRVLQDEPQALRSGRLFGSHPRLAVCRRRGNLLRRIGGDVHRFRVEGRMGTRFDRDPRSHGQSGRDVQALP